MPDKPNVERRKHPRPRVKIPATIIVKGSDERFEGEILDISLGGAFVHCTAPITVDQEIELEIDFSRAETLDAKVVVNQDAQSAKIPNTITEKVVIRWARGSSKSGFGVAFVNMNEEEKMDFVERVIRYFENLKKSGISFGEDGEEV